MYFNGNRYLYALNNSSKRLIVNISMQSVRKYDFFKRTSSVKVILLVIDGPCVITLSIEFHF